MCRTKQCPWQSIEIFGNLEGTERKGKNEDIDWKESWDRVTSCQKTRHLECKKQRNKERKKQTNKTACCRLQIPLCPSNNEKLNLKNAIFSVFRMVGIMDWIDLAKDRDRLGVDEAHTAVNTDIDWGV